MKSIRFAGLDGLRFISILFVVLHHLFTFKSYFGFIQLSYPIIGVIGLYGIHFFFTGSGFLITYLLLVEERRLGKINLRNFFIRRILRIWPAYFLLVLLMLAVYQLPYFRIPDLTDAYLSGAHQKSNLLYLVVLPHLSPFVNSTAPYVHPTYTIGIEEQFYFLWGVLFALIPKHFKMLMIVFAVSGPVFNLVHQQLFRYASTHQNPNTILIIVQKALYYFKYSKISVFAIGSMLGYAFFERSKWIYILRLKGVQIGLYGILGLSLFSGFEPPFIYFEYMALITGLVMLAATFREDSIFNFSAPWLEQLGKISYGIYLFHIFAIVLIIKWYNNMTGASLDRPFHLFQVCVATLLLATAFGYFSYHGYEKWFLKIKDRFRKV